MTQHHGGSVPPRPERSTPEVARDEAADVARTAENRGAEVGGTVGEQANRVASEASRQTRNLLREGREQLAGQTRQGQQRTAGGLRKVADQLHQMSERSDGQGVVPEMARQAADRTRVVADWLENREPGDLVDEVRRFARRKPGMFLLGAAVAGVAVGRLTRGAVAANNDDSDSAAPAPDRAPAPPVTPATAAPYPEQYTPPVAPPPPVTEPRTRQVNR